jgi:hypothetical protein
MRWIIRICLAGVLCTALAPAVSAAGLTGIEVMTSTVMQEKQSSFSGIALRMRIAPARLIEGIEIMPTVEYWRNTNTVDPFDIRTTRKDATLGADMRYKFSSARMQPYFGAGYALHFLASSVDAPSLGLNNETHALVKGGLAVMGGLSFPLTGRFENFVELKYHHIPSYRQLKFNWGLSMNL